MDQARIRSDAGPVSDFPLGSTRRAEAGGCAVAVVRTEAGEFRALTDRCPHAGAPLSEGLLRRGRLVCAWHGWTFDPATGRCENVPWAAAVPVHPVEVRDGRVLVGPAGTG